ncbi:MAG: GntR family transcriptional regulator, N-acetylglucosamine utilization regulator [Thermoanaerobacteraceae bacterium]|jgi:GntR family transcriptional regulator|uniref:UTRA domain-containing protein n=1 Tax=Biomaibacter acetigenes TaxID=2316383 RepID=A0A3G2R2T1_9FIRM|nr:GntR family transcriptional regulator [Biomaibacter acetigenes]AYO29794.1 UTRA domain-containing protein [Biomaibacter acetigenes]MDK2878297.1 GntR family transcriptional regulator, N-acetylglucosamine utilization regulator [Thermoanaerobacteraceae bacterium]MDN5311344.1 GntR family transcriptional regulator, N-acetylglucosamine utilization regulator [Thermoanaerobacteraceae bacterium]RKL64455.1 GntR family transcriptional regulator [Thermoanaerobacteraceae bacterium SP2]
MNLEAAKLNKDIPVPLYYQLKEILLSYIHKNQLNAGDPIPTEIELCQIFNISRPTVRQAINELVREGYLKKIKGKGTFITEPKINQEYTHRIISFNDEMIQKGLVPKTKVLKQRYIASDEQVAKKLNLTVGEEVFHLKRLRYTNDEPIVFLDSYVPLKLCPGIIEIDFVNNSLYATFEQKYGIIVKRAVRSIEVDLAGEYEAKLLHIKEGAPIHYFETVAYNQDNVAVEYTISRYRGDKSKFIVELVNA